MGEARNKQVLAFHPKLIEEWEADKCVNFAVALSRVTGWLLHVDWWVTSENPKPHQMTALRAYVGDNADKVFDARGIKNIFDFNERVIVRHAKEIGRKKGPGGVLTRFYGESELRQLSVGDFFNNEKIEASECSILENKGFLDRIPPRPEHCIPAYQAAKFTYGRCGPFAEALEKASGSPAVALLARRFSPAFEGTKRNENGYFHSVVLHPDGNAEDAWGISSLAEIGLRFGVIEFEVSRREHQRVVADLQSNTPELYAKAFELAQSLIATHRG